MSFLKDRLGRSAVAVAFTLGAFQALSLVGATSASAAGACSFAGGVVTAAAPAAGDNLVIYQDQNGGIHVATTTGAAKPLMNGTQDIAGCTGVQFGVATTTTINVTGDSGPTTNDQTIFIEMAVITAGTGVVTTTLADWAAINWTVNLGSNDANGDSLVILDSGNTTKPLNLTGGANGIDLNSDGNLDATVANVELFYLDSNSNFENTVDLSGSTATGGPFAVGAVIGQNPTANLNLGYVAATKASLMNTDTGDNVLKGGSGNDTIFGGLAADTIAPGLGSDAVNCNLNGGSLDLGGFFGDNQCTLDYSNTATAINANLPINTVTQGTDLDSVNTGAKDVIGTSAGDTLTGRDGENNWFQPGGGNDTVTGGTNIAVNSALQTGGDTVDFSDATTGVTVDLGAGTATGGSGSDTLSGMENVVGTEANDVITGNTSPAANNANLLWGMGGNDTLSGGAGDGDGSDYFNGGSGIDTIDYGNNTLATAVSVGVLAISHFNGVALEDDHIAGNTIENAILGSGDDAFTGSAFNNRVWPNGGQDALVGGGGIDTVDLSQGYTTGQTINLAGGGATGGSALSITGFVNAVGTAFNDNIIGTDVVAATNGANLLVGGKGNDSISGNAGPDLVRGGAGNDVIRGGNGDDDLFGSGGNDNIRGGNGDDNIKGGKGKDKCIGGGGRDIVKCEKAQKSRIRAARIARLSRI